MADLATPLHPLVQPSAAPALAPVGLGRRGRDVVVTRAPATLQRAGRARAGSEHRSGPRLGVTSQICWWTALTVGVTCSIVPIVSRGALVAWVAAVATLTAGTAVCVAGALQVARRDRRDPWTGLIACAGTAFAATQAVLVLGVVSRAGIAPSARLEVIGLFLLSIAYGGMATAGAWIRDLNAKVVTR